MSELNDFYRLAVAEQRNDLVRAIEAHEAESATGSATAHGTTIRAIAHTLTGSGGSFGFPAVTTAAAATEHSTDATLSMFARALVVTLDDIESMTPLDPSRRTTWDSHSHMHAGPIRILLAEDDPLTAALIIHRLEREAFEVAHCSNGLEALEAAATEQFDMIVLDVQMPGIDGFDVLDRIRATPELSEIPIVLVTAVGSEGDVVRGFALGADDYILKPFSPAELTARVKRLANGLT